MAASSPMVSSNPTIASLTSESTPRRVLGDLSPNMKGVGHSASAVGSLIKPLAGSALKRSFTAAVENSHGLTYLKKRKLSIDRPLNEACKSSPPRKRSTQLVSNESLQSGPTSCNKNTSLDSAESQRHRSPTQPNTPSASSSSSPLYEPRGGPLEHTSFSSIINYEPSSQVPISSHQRSSPRPQDVTRAELLKVRLQIAMYKIKTNQVDIPFAKLMDEGGPGTPSEQSPLTAVEATVQLLRRRQVARQLVEDSRQASGRLPRPASHSLL